MNTGLKSNHEVLSLPEEPLDHSENKVKRAFGYFPLEINGDTASFINLLNLFSFPILFLNEDGVIIHANPEATTFYGFSAEEFRGLNIRSINQFSDVYKDKIIRGTFTGHYHQFTAPHRLKNDMLKVVEVFASPLSIDDKKYLVEIITDTTEKFKARQSIKEQHEQVLNIMNAIPDTVMLLSKDGIIKYIKGGHTRSLFNGQDFTGKNIYTLNFPEIIIQDTMRVCHQAILMHEVIQYGHISDYKGTNKFCSVYAVPMNEDEALFLTRDITEEIEKTNIEKGYRRLFEFIDTPFLIMDAETCSFIDCNEAACKTFGYSKKELLKLNSRDIVLEGIMSTNDTIDITNYNDIKLIKKNGGIIKCNIRSFKAESNGRYIYIGILDDIISF